MSVVQQPLINSAEQNLSVQPLVIAKQLQQLPNAVEFANNLNKKRSRKELEEDKDPSENKKHDKEGSGKPKRKRMKYTSEQISLLENIYLSDPLPNLAKREELATLLKRSARSVQIWFQNKRAKDKKSKVCLPRSDSSGSLSGNEEQPQKVEGSSTTPVCRSPERSPSHTSSPQPFANSASFQLPSLSTLTSSVLGLNTQTNQTSPLPSNWSSANTQMSPDYSSQKYSSSFCTTTPVISHSFSRSQFQNRPYVHQTKSVFPIEKIQIGNYKQTLEETEVRAIFDSESMEISWEVKDNEKGTQKRMSIDFLDILYLQSNTLNERQATMSIYLLRPPRFFEEETNGSWKTIEDFSEGMNASKFNVHLLVFSKSIIDQVVTAIRSMHPRFAGCFIDDLYKRKLSPYHWFVPQSERTIANMEGVLSLIAAGQAQTRPQNKQ